MLYRAGSDGRGNATAYTHSSRTSGHQEGGLRAPHACKDCGRPFSRGGTNSLLHVQSGSRTTSTPGAVLTHLLALLKFHDTVLSLCPLNGKWLGLEAHICLADFAIPDHFVTFFSVF